MSFENKAMDEEKTGEVHRLERRVSQESDLSHQSHIDAFTPEEQKKIIRRIDRRLVLTCKNHLSIVSSQTFSNHTQQFLGGFMYCVSLMDRTNLGIAAVGGMYDGKIQSRFSIHQPRANTRPQIFSCSLGTDTTP